MVNDCSVRHAAVWPTACRTFVLHFMTICLVSQNLNILYVHSGDGVLVKEEEEQSGAWAAGKYKWTMYYCDDTRAQSSCLIFALLWWQGPTGWSVCASLWWHRPAGWLLLPWRHVHAHLRTEHCCCEGTVRLAEHCVTVMAQFSSHYLTIVVFVF